MALSESWLSPIATGNARALNQGRRPGTAIVPHLRRSSLDANQSRPYETVSKPPKTCADGLIARRGRGSAQMSVLTVSYSNLVTCDGSLTRRHRILRKCPSHNFGGKLSFETVSYGRAYSSAGPSSLNQF